MTLHLFNKIKTKILTDNRTKVKREWSLQGLVGPYRPRASMTSSSLLSCCSLSARTAVRRMSATRVVICSVWFSEVCRDVCSVLSLTADSIDAADANHQSTNSTIKNCTMFQSEMVSTVAAWWRLISQYPDAH